MSDPADAQVMGIRRNVAALAPDDLIAEYVMGWTLADEETYLRHHRGRVPVVHSPLWVTGDPHRPLDNFFEPSGDLGTAMWVVRQLTLYGLTALIEWNAGWADVRVLDRAGSELSHSLVLGGEEPVAAMLGAAIAVAASDPAVLSACVEARERGLVEATA